MRRAVGPHVPKRRAAALDCASWPGIQHERPVTRLHGATLAWIPSLTPARECSLNPGSAACTLTLRPSSYSHSRMVTAWPTTSPLGASTLNRVVRPILKRVPLNDLEALAEAVWSAAQNVHCPRASPAPVLQARALKDCHAGAPSAPTQSSASAAWPRLLAPARVVVNKSLLHSLCESCTAVLLNLCLEEGGRAAVWNPSKGRSVCSLNTERPCAAARCRLRRNTADWAHARRRSMACKLGSKVSFQSQNRRQS